MDHEFLKNTLYINNLFYGTGLALLLCPAPDGWAIIEQQLKRGYS
ncbi:hypothetical protein [Pseudomonas sp. RGM 3321]|nr:hypothetical protein [Pseudomonas sp. RGM 3321]